MSRPTRLTTVMAVRCCLITPWASTNMRVELFDLVAQHKLGLNNSLQPTLPVINANLVSHLSTSLLKIFEALNIIFFPAGMVAGSPVFGLRACRSALGLTNQDPNFRIETGSPFFKVCFMAPKTASVTLCPSVTVVSSVRATPLAKSSFVMSYPFKKKGLSIKTTVKWRIKGKSDEQPLRVANPLHTNFLILVKN